MVEELTENAIRLSFSNVGWASRNVFAIDKDIAVSTAQAGARGREGCCTYSLSLMYRLNQTESAILM
jgi:hypothetical protein